MSAEHTLAEQKGHTMMHTYIYIYPLTNVPTKCQPSIPRNSQDKILKLIVTITRSQVKSRSQNDVAQLQPITNIPTKYQRPTPYSFRVIAMKRF